MLKKRILKAARGKKKYILRNKGKNDRSYQSRKDGSEKLVEQYLQNSERQEKPLTTRILYPAKQNQNMMTTKLLKMKVACGLFEDYNI